MDETVRFPQTLMEAITYFADPDRALQFFVEMRWPDGITCPRCGHQEVSFISTRRIWKCKGCRQQFSAKVGTIMEDSPLGLDKWMACIWIVVNAKNAVSSYEIHRALGVRQPTAWFMLQRVRYALEAQSFEKFSGTIEADETFIGGKEKNKHKDKKLNAGRGTVGKAVVMGLLERHTGEARTKHVRDTTQKTLHAEVRANVEEGSALYTDTHGGYMGLIEIVVSTMAIVEFRPYQGQESHDPALAQFVDDLFNSTDIYPYDVTPEIAAMARKIGEKQHALTPTDTVHIATAIIAKADVLFTFDGDKKIGQRRRQREMIANSGKFGTPPLKISAPYVDYGRIFEEQTP